MHPLAFFLVVWQFPLIALRCVEHRPTFSFAGAERRDKYGDSWDFVRAREAVLFLLADPCSFVHGCFLIFLEAYSSRLGFRRLAGRAMPLF